MIKAIALREAYKKQETKQGKDERIPKYRVENREEEAEELEE